LSMRPGMRSLPAAFKQQHLLLQLFSNMHC
jgi:hypothetical protein